MEYSSSAQAIVDGGVLCFNTAQTAFNNCVRGPITYPATTVQGVTTPSRSVWYIDPKKDPSIICNTIGNVISPCDQWCIDNPGYCDTSINYLCSRDKNNIVCPQYPINDDIMIGVIANTNNLQYPAAQDFVLKDFYQNTAYESTVNNLVNAYCTTNPRNVLCARFPNLNDTIMRQNITIPSNLQYPAAQEWCRKNPGLCDIPASRYCSDNALSGSGATKDVFCSCLNSPVSRYNPLCVDRTCLAGTNQIPRKSNGLGGYVTNNMTILPCPNIVDCNTQIALEAAGRITTGNITLSQNCGNTTVDPPPVDPPVDPPVEPPIEPPVEQPFFTNNIMILIFIFCIILGILFYIVASRQYKKG
jgi:hypothetical protein